MDKLRRLLGGQSEELPQRHEAMTAPKVDFSFRIYWTKIGRQWDVARIQELRPQVLAQTQAPTFENNLVDRRYKVEGLDELAHSGASLLALLEVMDALEKVLNDEAT